MWDDGISWNFQWIFGCQERKSSTNAKIHTIHTNKQYRLPFAWPTSRRCLLLLLLSLLLVRRRCSLVFIVFRFSVWLLVLFHCFWHFRTRMCHTQSVCVSKLRRQSHKYCSISHFVYLLFSYFEVVREEKKKCVHKNRWGHCEWPSLLFFANKHVK